MRNTVIWAIAVATLLVASVAPSGLADSVTVSLPDLEAGFARPCVTSSTAAGERQSLESIRLPGFSSNTASGRPALPCKLIYVALPPDADLSTVTVASEGLPTAAVAGTYDIGPVPPVAPVGESQGVAILARDPAIYESTGYYPSEHVRVRGVGCLRTWKVAILELWPYCYSPSTGRVRALVGRSVELNFRSVPAPPAEPSDSAVNATSQLIVNAEDALAWYGAPSAAPPGYLIVTTGAILAQSEEMRRFADLLSLRGFAVTIATERDWGGGIGDLAANNIRDWLRDNYLRLNAQYALLVGDPNPATGDVPMKMLWPRYNQSAYRDAPSDYFYADLTGDWDLDGDGIYGEERDDFGPEGIDRMPELYVGRIPYYGDICELDYILRKTIDYQCTELGDWSRRFLLAMRALDQYTPAYQLGERIRGDVALPNGFASTRLYDSHYDLDPAPERCPCDYDSVLDEWRRGAGFVFWMTHGSATDAGGVMSADRCECLDDSKPAIVYQASCSNGQPENPSNLAYCLLRRGAVCTVAGSRSTWYYIGETDFASTGSVGSLGYRYALGLVKQGYHCARALAEAKLTGPLYIWSNQLVLNLYGDPSLVFGSPAPGAVYGRVRTIGGTPIEGAVIRTEDGLIETRSGHGGSYCLTGLVPGAHGLTVSAEGFYPQRFTSVSVVSGRREQLDVRLVGAGAGSLTGRVRDVYGSPIADAEVWVEGHDCRATTSYDGAYLLDNLPPGEYTVSAARFPYAEQAAAGCAVDEGRLTHVDLVLRSRTANALKNGGFEEQSEDGAAPYWSTYSSAEYAGSVRVTSDQKRQGASSQRIALPPSALETYAGVYQRVAVVPGSPYSLVAWLRCHSEGDPRWARCRVGCDSTGGTDCQSSSITWLELGSGTSGWCGAFTQVMPLAPVVTVFMEARCLGTESKGDAVVWFDGASLTGPVVAPAVPVVRVKERCQSGLGAVSAEWSCSEPGAVEFELAVSASTDEGGIVPGGEWQSVGTARSATRTGLSLCPGDCVRVLVRARDDRGVASEAGVSAPVRIVRDVDQLASAASLPDGSWVRIPGLCVSRMGQGPECFVQDVSRVRGLRVTGDWSGIPYLQPGARVSVVGRIVDDGAWRVLHDAEVMPSAVGEAPGPLAMLCRSVGGAGLRPPVVCAEGGRAASRGLGADNLGLLVTVAGRVVDDSTDRFLLRDGSLPEGIAVLCFNSAMPPNPGEFVRVTGIAIPQGIAVFGFEDITVIPER